MDYSRTIRTYRLQNKLSQASFAKLVNTYSSTICNYERKKKVPGKEMKQKINEVIFGMKPKMVSIKSIPNTIETKIVVQPVEITYDDINGLIKIINTRFMDDDKDTKVHSVLTVKYNEKDHLHRFIKENVASQNESPLIRAIA